MDVNVAQVAAGENHTVICTAEGHAWAFADAEHNQLYSLGQLGHGDNATRTLPEMLGGLAGVKVALVT